MALPTTADLELWEQVRHNDPDAFETLYRRYMRVLLAAIYKWTENQAIAEDILQEVFLDVWERRASIQIRGQLFQYLYSMTRYKGVD